MCASASNRPPAIELQGLRKCYGGKVALDGLNLVVPSGCFFGFLGPNGAGKTTTIRILIGLTAPSAGSVRLLGLPMPGKAFEVKRRIGVVPEDSLLFDRLTGAEFLQFAARLYGLGGEVAAHRAAELLALFELDKHPRKLIGEYSKGMRKRLMMAAALIHRPELLLLDEPFEGVDAIGARLMKDLLAAQVRRGATVFLTSHVLEVVERLCDRVAILHQGRLLLEAGVSELRQAAESLEDVFVRVVGAAQSGHKLEWL